MTREEAIAKGIEVKETQHSMKRRTPWHDYSRIGTYMITLVVNNRQPLLGSLTGRIDAEKGSAESPHVVPSELGRRILKEELPKINQFYPMVEVWKACLMPDHIHLIMRVKEPMGKGGHLGRVISGFKAGCSKAWWSMMAPCGERQGTVADVGATVPAGSPAVRRPVLFEKGYNDKILMHDKQLENWKRYLNDNPRRLLMKRLNPHLFTTLTGVEVAGKQCQLFGNRFLLDIPDKVAVIVHRRYTDEENDTLCKKWLACGERGGVLVGAAIAKKEKEVMREAMNRGYRIILLRENGFPEIYKPSGESFDACAEGRLLQISPWEYHIERKVITREQCLFLNAMAESIASECQTKKDDKFS